MVRFAIPLFFQKQHVFRKKKIDFVRNWEKMTYFVNSSLHTGPHLVNLALRKNYGFYCEIDNVTQKIV